MSEHEGKGARLLSQLFIYSLYNIRTIALLFYTRKQVSEKRFYKRIQTCLIIVPCNIAVSYLMAFNVPIEPNNLQNITDGYIINTFPARLLYK